MSNRTSLRLRVLPRFPARIMGANGLDAERDGADMVVKPDFGALVQIPSVSTPETTYFWGWDQSIDMYSRISFQDLVSNIQDVIIGPTTAAMEATTPGTDQFIYFTGPDAAAVTGLTDAGRALLDDANAAAQRTTLGLAGAAILDVGTTAGTVAAGDDSRIVNAVQTSRTLTAGTGLTGGGDLTANRSLALNSASIASLAKADSALQPTTGATEFFDIPTASAATIPGTVARISTKFHSPNPLLPDTYIGGAHYRRVPFSYLSGYPTQSYFRTVDRFLPNGTTDATQGGYWVLDETQVDWRMLGVKTGVLFDDTVAAQSAIDFVLLDPNRRVLRLSGQVYASKLSFGGGLVTNAAQMQVVSDNCFVVANSSSAQTCLIEIKIPNINWSGRFVAIVGYRTNYECAYHLWHETAMQFGNLDCLNANRAAIGFRIGSTAYPSALISELSLTNTSTYGCPVVFEAIGGETYISINGPQNPADSFGGDAAWQAREKIFIRNVGASVIVGQGEAIIPGDTNGVLVEMQPINRGAGRVEWGAIQFDTVFCESASPICRTANPLGLTINPASSRRGLIQFDNCIGFHSQDLAALINIGPDYHDNVTVNNPDFWFINGQQRTKPNIFCHASSRAKISVRGEFGEGFLKGVAGIVGGIVSFDRRVVARAIGLNGRNFTAAGGAEACLYTSLDNSGDRSRWAALYNSATGEFTVPIGGLKDVEVALNFRLNGTSTGALLVFENGGEVARSVVSAGIGNFSHCHGDLAEGAKISIKFDSDANDSGSAINYLNSFTVTARY